MGGCHAVLMPPYRACMTSCQRPVEDFGVTGRYPVAKKKVAQEPCMFCKAHPCECWGVSRNKMLREKHGGTDERPPPEEGGERET